MPLTEARASANKRYQQKFDDIKFRVPKGQREILQNHAQSQGESLNGFLARAVSETMARDKGEDA